MCIRDSHGLSRRLHHLSRVHGVPLARPRARALTSASRTRRPRRPRARPRRPVRARARPPSPTARPPSRPAPRVDERATRRHRRPRHRRRRHRRGRRRASTNVDPVRRPPAVGARDPSHGAGGGYASQTGERRALYDGMAPKTKTKTKRAVVRAHGACTRSNSPLYEDIRPRNTHLKKNEWLTGHTGGTDGRSRTGLDWNGMESSGMESNRPTGTRRRDGRER